MNPSAYASVEPSASTQELRQSILSNSLRFPLICLVVFIHIIPNIRYSTRGVDGGLDVFRYISELISHVWGDAAVPTFFFIAGYYAFYKSKNWLAPSIYKVEVKKKVFGLLLPYIFWNVLFVATYAVKDFLSLGDLTSDSFPITWSMFSDLWSAPPNYPLWFVRDLICVSLLAPIVLWSFKRMGGILPAVLFLCYCLEWEIGISGFSTTALFYWTFGAYLGYKKYLFLVNLRGISNILLPFWFIASLLIPLVNQTSVYGSLHHLFVALSVAAFFSLADRLFSERTAFLLERFSKVVFFIYVTHALLIINLVKGAMVRAGLPNINDPETYPMSLITYFLVGGLTIGICLGLYYVARCVSPRLLDISTGGRG